MYTILSFQKNIPEELFSQLHANSLKVTCVNLGCFQTQPEELLPQREIHQNTSIGSKQTGCTSVEREHALTGNPLKHQPQNTARQLHSLWSPGCSHFWANKKNWVFLWGDRSCYQKATLLPRPEVSGKSPTVYELSWQQYCMPRIRKRRFVTILC